MDVSLETFKIRLSEVNAAIEVCCLEAGRAVDSVKLLPVTKNHPVDAAHYAFEEGLRAVGENRVQETEGKFRDVDASMAWELIGPLQTNKAKKALEVFSRIQTVDREKLVNVLQRNCSEMDRQLPVLMQVNAGRDPNKAGISLEEADFLA